MKTAIITGCTGQDGLILTNLLIKEKVNVYGISKDSLFKNNSRIGKFNIFSESEVASGKSLASISCTSVWYKTVGDIPLKIKA